MENLSHDIECVSDAISDIQEKVLKLRVLVDASSADAERLVRDMQAMTHQERFEAVMELWRKLTKIGTAGMWLDIHTGTARRHTNYLLDATAKEDA
ncbi:MAG: hypothetical protein ACJ8HI_21770 [Massilia sp.]|jgi:hypothetical protein